MMTYDEWIGDNSLFDEMLLLIEDENLNSLDHENMDMVFSLLYGDRKVIEKLHKYDVSQIAKMLVTKYEFKWVRAYQLLYDEVISGESSSITVKDINKTLSKRNMTRDNENRVSAYNDDSYSPDSDSGESVLDENDTDTEKTKTTQTKSLWAVQQQLWLINNNIVDIMIEDIAGFITVKIY